MSCMTRHAKKGRGMDKQHIAAITVVFGEKDGIVHAYSPQLAGLHVCGKTRSAVIADTPGVIKKLYKLKHGWNVEVTLSRTPEFKRGKVPPKDTKVANFIAVQEAQPA